MPSANESYESGVVSSSKPGWNPAFKSLGTNRWQLRFLVMEALFRN